MRRLWSGLRETLKGLRGILEYLRIRRLLRNQTRFGRIMDIIGNFGILFWLGFLCVGVYLTK